jgi:protein involved in polysaccharide export with SLBB domain
MAVERKDLPAIIINHMHSRHLLSLLLLGACSSAPPFDAKAVVQEWAAYMQRDYTLRAGDRLSIRVDQLATAEGASVQGQGQGPGQTGGGTQEVVVSPNGTIDLRKLEAPLHVAGTSVGAARSMIISAYERFFTETPRVTVTLVQAATESVYVCGEVRTGGVFPYHPGMTMMQAIAAAEGFQITVKESDIRILRMNQDGSQRTFRVNMSDVLYGNYPDFLLLPGDVVYCQTSLIADLGNLVELYIRRLLPFALTGVSIGGSGN